MLYFRHIGGSRNGEVDSFDLDRVKIGRNEDADLRYDPLRDAEVSGAHAEVHLDGGSPFVRDLGSTNGTYVNGVRIHEATPLSDGDKIAFSPRGPTVSFSRTEPRRASTLLVDASTLGEAPATRKTVTMMFGDALRDTRATGRGRVGSTMIFVREFVQEFSTYASRRLRVTVICIGIVAFFTIAGLIIVNIKTGKQLRGAIEVAGAQGQKLAGLNEQAEAQRKQIAEQEATLTAQQQKIDELQRILTDLKEHGVNARPMENGIAADLSSVLFGYNSADLTDEGNRQVAHVGSVVMRSKEIERVDVEGYASREGEGREQHNLVLSTARAKTVRDALVAGGVVGDRVAYQGHGESERFGSNATEEGRQKNRRVEILMRTRTDAVRMQP